LLIILLHGYSGWCSSCTQTVNDHQRCNWFD